jgi:hypothetical protein
MRYSNAKFFVLIQVFGIKNKRLEVLQLRKGGGYFLGVGVLLGGNNWRNTNLLKMSRIKKYF